MSQLFSLDFWSLVGAVSGIYAIFSLGLQLQFGFTGLLNFGHVASMAVGAYTMAILVAKEHVPLWGASLLAIAAGMLFGAALSLPTLRLRADYFAIATIAISETVRYVALNEPALDRRRGGDEQPERPDRGGRVQHRLGLVPGGLSSAGSATSSAATRGPTSRCS